MDLHPLDPQASPTRLIIFALKAAVDFLPLPVLGMGLYRLLGAHRSRRGELGREPGHLLPPTRAPTRRTTGPSSSPGQPPGTPLRLPTNRYDTSEECEVLGRFWEQVKVKLCSPRLPLARPVGWGADKVRRRKRLYDTPSTPPGRLLDTDALTKAQKTDLISYRNQLNPAAITRRIIELQDVLICLAKDKTDEHLPRPDPQHPARHPQGVRLRKAS